MGNIGKKFTPNILDLCNSDSSDNMITSQLFQTIYPDFLSLLSKYEGPQIYSCTKTLLCVLGILNTFIKMEASTPEHIAKNHMSIWYTLVLLDSESKCFN